MDFLSPTNLTHFSSFNTLTEKPGMVSDSLIKQSRTRQPLKSECDVMCEVCAFAVVSALLSFFVACEALKPSYELEPHRVSLTTKEETTHDYCMLW